MHKATIAFFGLTEPAFTRPPQKPYLDPPRQKALEQLQQLIARRGFAVLSGAPGCGKTALLHYLANTLSDNHHQLTYVPFSFLEKGHMLQFIAARMGLPSPRGIAATLHLLHKHLHDLQPVNPILVLDEAERLELDTLHILRLLVHHRPDTACHCTLILAAAKAFIDQTLRLQINEPLRQRITLYIHLHPLDLQHTPLYLAHHLKHAGAAAELFSPPAVQLIHDLAKGVPRILNTLAEAAMDIAAQRQQPSVALDHVHQAAETVLPPSLPQAPA